LAEFGLEDRVERVENLMVLEPLGYLEFLRLMEHAGVVVTDSGGIQEETTFLQVPCLTLRENTERPVTVERGTNELLSLDPEIVSQRVEDWMLGEKPDGQIPDLWDGKAAQRIVKYVQERYAQAPAV